MKPLLVSSGEPAGIGPDLCLSLAGSGFPIVILGDKSVLAARADQLGLEMVFDEYQPGVPLRNIPSRLVVWSLPCKVAVKPGELDPRNAAYVMDMLDLAMRAVLSGEFSALVTAPVHKGVINQAGFSFTGHTEYFAAGCGVDTVVMMLVSSRMRVAMVTTHLPLKEVSAAITIPRLTKVIAILHRALQTAFGISSPRIEVAGLNPHAGEGGYLGREEIDVIIPTLTILREQNWCIEGPFSADTLFIPKEHACDAYLAMYHDQGLPIIKYASFGQAVNVTLGLPIIRTSVDHGTALGLAGQRGTDTGSMLAAVKMAMEMAAHKKESGQ